MGGNAFEDLQKLTPAEYKQITQQLYEMISPMCQKIQPYIPLPQKQIHGDIDFLILFKPGYKLENILELLKLNKQEYIINNNLTANTVYRKKQIDFNICLDLQQFERIKFYKSYGGIGAFLGLLLPSKFVKVNEDGIFCCQYHQHIKMEFNVCSQVPEILRFYGLSPQKYEAGFKTRIEVFEFLLKTRFFDPVSFRQKKPKWTTKLINFFKQYLEKNHQVTNPHYQHYQDPVKMTLKYFKKQEEFEERWQKTMLEEEKKKKRTEKWNGKHIMDVFGVSSKQLNPIKKKFQMSLGTKENYHLFIEEHSFEQIVEAFSKVCQLEPKKKEVEIKQNEN